MESKSRNELIILCRERGLKGYSTKTKAELITLLTTSNIPQTVLDKGHEYIFQNMLTCIGNKRKLVKHIYNIVHDISKKIGRNKLRIMDGFAGSGVVSRQLSYISSKLIANDLELYSYIMCQCYLKTPNIGNQDKIRSHIDRMNSIAESGPFFEGFISKLYAPKDTHNISPGERCFYTRENALIIDTLRKYISDSIEEDLQIYCLAPLLNKASIHTNTAGVFKGFYKKDGIGHFGGAGEHALDRIMRKIQLEYPVWNNELEYESVEYESVECHNKDINVLLDELKDNDLDILYLDPPYNQHPYGSNYFMLNLIAKGIEPSEISKVSGIPVEWNKSMYNSSLTAKDSMHQLINTGLKKSRYLLISYNDEGIISSDDWKELLDGLIIQKYEIVYDTYKGSRNLESRNNKVTEIMYLVSKPV